GPEIFKQKLREAGIEQNIIDEYALLYNEEQPLDKIIKLANKILKQKKGPQIKREEKLKQSLMQKGYTFETINIVMEELDFSQ
ncbi:RecX family transcriptional regulator, partial [Acinetobacter junii]